MNDPFRLNDRVALVSGYSSGIGRATAIAMAERGALVIGIDLDEVGAAVTSSLVAETGGQSRFFTCDIASESAITDVFDELDRGKVRVDALVNNAAAPVARAHPEDAALDDWNRALQTNLTGYFLCAREVGRRLISGEMPGTIVNVGSINGVSALGRGNLAYSVSKAGVGHLTKELAVEWAVHGIRVNAVLPCQVRTKKLDELLAHGDINARTVAAAALGGIPLGRFGEPDEIAWAITFLSSRSSSLITGAMLP